MAAARRADRAVPARNEAGTASGNHAQALDAERRDDRRADDDQRASAARAAAVFATLAAERGDDEPF